MRIGIIFAAVVAAVFGIFAVSYIGAYNTGNRLERALVATQENNKNILAQYGNSIAEAAQVTDMQREDLIEVVTAALEGRYGEDGSGAVFQAITEDNPDIDSSVYVRLQDLIEAGRNDFKNGQTALLDQKRVYETALGSFWQGSMLSLAGYPRTNLAEIQIVSTERANTVFETNVESPISLR